MIVDLILTLLAGVLKALLTPLEVFNVAVDLVSSMPVVVSFLQIVAYLFPWSNLLPLIFIIFFILNFKFVVSAISALWNLIPFV